MGGPRAWYCPECRKARDTETNRAYHIRKRLGGARAIGSTDLCVICGKPYTVEGGLQRYCKECAPAAVKRIDNAQSRAWNAANIVPEERNAKRRVGTQEMSCKICGTSFLGYRNQRYCSDACRVEGVRAIMRETDERRAEQHNATRREHYAAKKEKEPPSQ